MLGGKATARESEGKSASLVCPLSHVKVEAVHQGYWCCMEPNENSDELTVSPETAFYIIVKAREFDEQVEPTDPEFGLESN